LATISIWEKLCSQPFLNSAAWLHVTLLSEEKEELKRPSAEEKEEK